MVERVSSRISPAPRSANGKGGKVDVAKYLPMQMQTAQLEDLADVQLPLTAQNPFKTRKMHHSQPDPPPGELVYLNLQSQNTVLQIQITTIIFLQPLQPLQMQFLTHLLSYPLKKVQLHDQLSNSLSLRLVTGRVGQACYRRQNETPRATIDVSNDLR